MTSPRRWVNQRVATIADMTSAVTPVPTPSPSPTSSAICQNCVIANDSEERGDQRNRSQDHAPQAVAFDEGGGERRDQAIEQDANRKHVGNRAGAPAEFALPRAG